MGGIVDWIVTLYEKVSSAIQQIAATVTALPGKIDAISFGADSGIVKALALIHYVLGNPLYYLFSSLLTLGIGFVMYRVAKIIINLVNSMLSAFKAKFIIP